MRSAENAAQPANLVEGFRSLIRNPHVWVGGIFHICSFSAHHAAASFQLDVNGAIRPLSTYGLVGTATNDNASAGSVGEYISSTVGPVAQYL
jgi:hypothetical protein